MMNFKPVPCPPTFEEECRKPGLAWLAENAQAKRPPAYWSPFKAELQEGFHDLCAYSCIYTSHGTVDHYLSWKTNPGLAYDWGNYRFASELMNSIKQNADDRVLDPFQVGDDWFEIILPSLQLVITEAVPEEYRERARYTLERLRLRDDERVLRPRRKYYRMYQEGKLPLDALRVLAPLIARAVEKQQQRSE